MARTLLTLGSIFLFLFPATLAIKFYKYGQCVHASPCAEIPTNGLVDDWALLVATAPAADNILSFWGPTFYGCDTNSIQETCCSQGIFYTQGDDNNSSMGFVYGYNKQLEKWTIQDFVTFKTTIPGTTLTAYETFYYDYVSIDNSIVFKDGRCQAISGTEIVLNPMLRRVRWVLLETDQNQSYRIILNCENVDGFLYNGYPQIQIYVKRSQIANFNKVSDIQSLTMYDAIQKALTRQKINPAFMQWQIISQEIATPTEVLFNSINFDSCKCKITGTAAAIASLASDKGYY